MGEEPAISRIILHDRTPFEISNKITKIEQGPEWFLIWEGEHLKCKLNVKFITAVYYK